MIEAHAEAVRFYRGELLMRRNHWAKARLQVRGLGQVLEPGSRWKVGYAPEAWSHLIEHMREKGFEDRELVESGLAVLTRNGYLIDRFRDRIIRGCWSARSSSTLNECCPGHRKVPATPAHQAQAGPVRPGGEPRFRPAAWRCRCMVMAVSRVSDHSWCRLVGSVRFSLELRPVNRCQDVHMSVSRVIPVMTARWRRPRRRCTQCLTAVPRWSPEYRWIELSGQPVDAQHILCAGCADDSLEIVVHPMRRR
ncbi:hypothetical protein [Kribbella sp. NPDC051770]|uniref:hypothetical protein n=1 Tax=Kribbella sp. NPDC051770 TaxID=3155413 RepID=UPI0034368EF5